VQTYYADKKERPLLQHDLIESQRTEKNTGWEVLITTYQLASTDGDRRFFKKFDWEVGSDLHFPSNVLTIVLVLCL
jgi:SWI/SNF-related matrix-associated actin-dependent regulator 1 of chromatin subfamily A